MHTSVQNAVLAETGAPDSRAIDFSRLCRLADSLVDHKSSPTIPLRHSAGMKRRRTLESDKYSSRARMMQLVAEGHRTLVAAADLLGISYRQAKRIYRRYRIEGAAGVVHRSVGKPSHRRMDEQFKTRVLARYRQCYRNLGPTTAAKKLSEDDGIEVHHETLRRWLIGEGLWQVRQRGLQCVSRKQSRRRFGELVRFDDQGRHENRAEGDCLMSMVDDATGTSLAFLTPRETAEAAMRLLWVWIERYGIPEAVYCDRASAFVSEREPTIQEQLLGTIPLGPFERACEKLGVEVIVARSPRTRGRVTCSSGVWRHHLIDGLRLPGIIQIEAVKGSMQNCYVESVNGTLAKVPADGEDAHVRLLSGQSLENILCFEEQRVVSRNYVVQYERRFFHLRPQMGGGLPAPGSSITVRKWLDGSLHFVTGEGAELRVEELPHKPKRRETGALSA